MSEPKEVIAVLGHGADGGHVAVAAGREGAGATAGEALRALAPRIAHLVEGPFRLVGYAADDLASLAPCLDAEAVSANVRARLSVVAEG